MKNAVIEFLEPTEIEKKVLWEQAFFIFDTNVLLNLYRYSNKTRDILLSAIQKLKDRIWMPNHIAYEFMKNRCSTIYRTVDSYEKLEKESDLFITRCQEALRLKKDDAEIVSLNQYIVQWIEKSKHKNLLVVNPRDDSLLQTILELYNGKVGTGYDEDELKRVSEEGGQRYKNKIPPGYKDIEKNVELLDNNIYGDLIIWKQLMCYSKDYKKHIIYVTHDQKEDWWNIVQGKTIGPRIELRKEFYSVTSQKFDMYSMDSFIDYFGKFYGAQTEQSVIEEIRIFDQRKNISSRIELENTIEELRNKINENNEIICKAKTKYQKEELTDDVKMRMIAIMDKNKQLIERMQMLEVGYKSLNDDIRKQDTMMLIKDNEGPFLE